MQKEWINYESTKIVIWKMYDINRIKYVPVLLPVDLCEGRTSV